MNWYRYQRVASADPSRPWESLAGTLEGLPALVFRYGRERCGQMSRFKPLTRNFHSVRVLCLDIANVTGQE